MFANNKFTSDYSPLGKIQPIQRLFLECLIVLTEYINFDERMYHPILRCKLFSNIYGKYELWI